jgi:hypothetical protein
MRSWRCYRKSRTISNERVAELIKYCLQPDEVSVLGVYVA